jgi:peptidoglycan/xylan/chitin deacetylase (PgdA/CDA1 family)
MSRTLYPGLISATPEALEAQAGVLAEQFHLVSLDELLAARRGEQALPARSAMVTFDDAYVDFESTAWPILRARGVPVTLFVATAYPDRDDLPFWWDRLHEILEHAEGRGVIESPVGLLPVHDATARRSAYLRCRDHLRLLPTARSLELLEEMAEPLDVPAPRSAVLGWESLRRLAQEGVRIAAHTRTHPLLASTELAAAAEELSGSIADVERELGRSDRVIAYPAGSHDDRIVELAGELRLDLAFTIDKWGGNDLGRGEWLRLRRILVSRRSTVPLMRLQLVPATSALRHLYS